MRRVYYDDNGDVQMDFPSNSNTVEVIFMKTKTTFYNHNVGKDYDPLLHVSYPPSRADQLSYVPTAKLVDTMFKTGQMLQASKLHYDFPDGKDDGRAVPIDRSSGFELPEISQQMASNEAKLSEHKKNIEAMTKKEAKKKAENEPPAKEETKETSEA